MMAQIPLPWQLTDMLCAMGLGFLYAAVYAVLRRLAGSRSAPRKRVVFSVGAKQLRRLRRSRRVLGAAGEALLAAACVFFTRAWVLTASHAAQFRWSMALGLAAGFAVYWRGAAPVLRCWGQCFFRLTAPLRRMGGALRRFSHKRNLMRRERRRLTWNKRQEQRQTVLQKRLSSENVTRRASNTQNLGKEMQKNQKNRLQNPQRIYYNNL